MSVCVSGGLAVLGFRFETGHARACLDDYLAAVLGFRP